jgi:thiol-disulfide isomerase/thioredoxin
MNIRIQALLLCLLLLAPFSMVACGGGGLNPETAAPDFTVTDAAGNTVHLSDYRGKPVVVNFWATWCPPCVGELPHFNKAIKTYEDRVTFLMVNVDGNGTADIETAFAFMQQNGYDLPLYFDLSYNASYTYGVSSIPMTIWVDEHGNLYNVYVGMLTEEYLTHYIDLMLAD